MRPELKGQGVLEGMSRPSSLDMNKQVSFQGAMSSPEDWGVTPYYLDQDTFYKMSLMSAERIKGDLIGVKPGSPSAVGYKDGSTGIYTRIALTPTEYSFIPRSPDSIGRAVLNRTLASRPPREEFTPDKEAADRSMVHAAFGYISKMDTYIKNTIEPDIDQIKKFQEYVEHPYLRRLKGNNLRTRLEWVRGHVFDDMIVALSQQRKWTSDQERMAREALDARLFLDRDNNNYIENWKDILGLANTYLGHKWALFKTKQLELRKITRR